MTKVVRKLVDMAFRYRRPQGCGRRAYRDVFTRWIA